ncbi:hypothetical protein BH683_012410 [Williamsia sp. 1138]|uniref:hypothetical protein n=1 Tax=Williamsia sp. 1138 TaxID=1903117 RepID=UPI000A0F8628|nr:hypothetical protein [Williamsia sp. 1138]OZG28881.1 hypothetical protein BH683_012410 [Williamsia sp. 1138]
MRTIRADVEPVGHCWLVRLPELDGINGFGTAFTQARTRDEITVMAIDLAAIILELYHNDIEITVTGVRTADADD